MVKIICRSFQYAWGSRDVSWCQWWLLGGQLPSYSTRDSRCCFIKTNQNFLALEIRSHFNGLCAKHDICVGEEKNTLFLSSLSLQMFLMTRCVCVCVWVCVCVSVCVCVLAWEREEESEWMNECTARKKDFTNLRKASIIMWWSGLILWQWLQIIVSAGERERR